MIITNFPRTEQRASLALLIQRYWKSYPLLTLASFLMFATLLGTLIGLLVDPRVITGMPAWEKPSKFALSLAIYGFTLLWFVQAIKGHPRLARFVTNATAINMIVEAGIVIAQVLRGTTSHFNFSTPLDSMLYEIMGGFTVLIWSMALIAAFLLLRQRFTDPIFAWSLRLGLVVTILGMSVAFLMLPPTALQLAALRVSGHMYIIGAHSVGVPDGGPGLPFLGWSTTGGDLRIPHFFGLHALQVLPMIGWLLAQHTPTWLRRPHRLTLLWTAALAYLALIALLTWQALRAQSIIAPDALSITAGVLWLVLVTIIVSVTYFHARLTSTHTVQN